MVTRFLFLLSLLFSLRSCGQALYERQLRLLYKNTVPVISPEKLAELIKSGAMVYLLDVRSPRENEVSHLPGARFLDFATFTPNQVQDIPKQARVVVYCSIGVRSESVGVQLQKAGYSQVYNLYGGLFAWKNKGYSVVDTRQQVTDSVHTYNRYCGVWLHNAIKVYE